MRLKAILRLWMPWARQRFRLTPAVEGSLLAISPRTIADRLAAQKRTLTKRLYGRTKPGTLLKRMIPIQTEAWKVGGPGFVEVDLVSHAGPTAQGEFLSTLNLTTS